MSAVEPDTACSAGVPPGCPAAPEVTVAFCSERWRADLDVARWTSLLERRERVMRDLRAAGDPRAGDAVGWLTLAGVLAYFPVRLVRRIAATSDPAGLADDVATATGDGHGALRRDPESPPGRFHVAADLDVVDAGSRSAFAVAEFAGRAAAEEVIVVAGTPVVPSVARRLLRGRILAALDRQAVRR